MNKRWIKVSFLLAILPFLLGIAFYSSPVSAQIEDPVCVPPTGFCCSNLDCDNNEECSINDPDLCLSGGCDGVCSSQGDIVCCQGPGCGLGCAPPQCGNGIYEPDNLPPEQCDLGGRCLKWNPDGSFETGSACTIGGAGCDTVNGFHCFLYGEDAFGGDNECLFCQLNSECGDGIINPLDRDVSEQCDDGGLCSVSGTPCNTIGYTHGWGETGCPVGEACIPQSGDGCSDTCQLEGTGSVSCQGDDIMFRISGVTNALAEEYDASGNYPIPVCYSNFFSDPIPSNPWDCAVHNKIIRFSDDGSSPITNAHAENPARSTNGYSDICYGNLNCVLSSPGEACSDIGAGYVKILGLADDTDAHVENSTENNYNRHLCCSLGGGSGGAGQIVSVGWEFPEGAEIAERYVNDSVYLVAETSGMADGAQIVFEIFEDDPLLDDDIRTEGQGTQFTVSVSGNRASVLWDITDVDMENGGDNGAEVDPWEFFFKARKSDDISIQAVSENLPVHNFENPNPPNAEICSPEQGKIYFVESDVLFDATCSTNVQNYLWTVEFNDAVEFTDSRALFTWNFTEPGQRRITLEVSNSAGSDADQIEILVVASPYMFSYVGDPFYGEIVQTLDEPPMTMFSAADSYVVNIEDDGDGDGCPDGAQCLGGFCPQSTSNVPNTCGLPSIPITGAPATPADADYSQLNFDWTFGEEDRVVENIAGLGVVQGEKSYSKKSGDRDDKWIDLTVAYDDSANGISLSQNTDREFTLGQCINDGRTFIETDGNGNFVAEYNTEAGASGDTFFGCSGGDGTVDDGNECCPAGWICDEATGGCVGSEVNECSDYSTQSECEDDDYGVGSAENPVYSGLVDSCEDQVPPGSASVSCVWDSDDGCRGDITCTQSSCTGVDCGNTLCTHYSCVYDTSPGECVNGYMQIGYTLDVASSSPGTCDPGITIADVCDQSEVVVPCGRLNFELSFFDYTQFIIAAIAIFLIYFVWHHLRAERKKE